MGERAISERVRGSVASTPTFQEEAASARVRRIVLRSERGETSTKMLRNVIELSGRVLLAALFLLSGVGKIFGYAVTVTYMTAAGVPGALLPFVIALEVGGALAIVVGWQTRITALLLAGFTLLSALLFHNDFGDQVQAVMFLKNVSIAGGLLLLVANGAGRLSVDRGAE